MANRSGIVYFGRIGRNKGGPSGYIYNMASGAKAQNLSLDVYCSPSDENSNAKGKSGDTLFVKFSRFRNLGFLYLLMMPLIECIYLAKSYLSAKRRAARILGKDVLAKEVLHFQHPCELYFFSRWYRFSGRLLLTPHSPQPMHLEIIQRLKTELKTLYSFPLVRWYYTRAEKIAYQTADGFVFPCPEAKGLYETFPNFSEGASGKQVAYVLTGTPVVPPDISREEYRAKIGIGPEDKLLVYIGRHLAVKGYDLLVKAYPQLKESNIKVVCAGEILGDYPQDSGWVELGQIRDPYNLICCADAVLLPNRNTYFDLIALEVLAQGKLLIASDTGGNLTLARYTRGVRLFPSENIDSMVAEIRDTLSLPVEQRRSMEEANRAFYQQYCTPEQFAKNYLAAIEPFLADSTGVKVTSG